MGDATQGYTPRVGRYSPADLASLNLTVTSRTVSRPCLAYPADWLTHLTFAVAQNGLYRPTLLGQSPPEQPGSETEREHSNDGHGPGVI